MGVLLGVLVLWGSTLGIIGIDKSMRANQPRSDDALMPEEPGWGGLIALTILINIVALPYYFYVTRRSVAWGLVGFLAFVGCATLMVVVQFVAAIAGVR
jgi:hypothetical protein